MTSKWLRKLLLVVAGLTLLMIAVLAWFVLSFDANAYKSLAIDWMKTHRNRTLQIEGPVELSVFPRLSIQFSDVKLSERGVAEEFAALDSASLSVDPLALLRKQLMVDRVSARGLRVVYRRDAQGKANIDDLTANEAPPEPSTPASNSARHKSSPTPHFDVQHIQLEDLRLSMRDDFAHITGEITLNSFTSGRLSAQVESPVELNAQLTLKSPAAQGTLSGRALLSLDLGAGSVRLRDMQLAWKGHALGVQDIDTTLKGTLAFDGTQRTLQASDLQLGLMASLGSLKLKNSTIAMHGFIFNPEHKTLALSQLSVKLAGSQDGHPIVLALDWPTLDVKGDSLSGSALTGKITMGGPHTLDATFKSAAPKGSFDKINVPEFEATLKGQSGSRAISGSIRADLQLQSAQSMLTVESLNSQFQVQEPSLRALTIGLKGRADASTLAAHWALTGQIDAHAFSSDGSATFAATPITVNLNATFEALDLNRLLAPTAATTTAAQPAVAAKPAAPANEPVDLSALQAVQGHFKLRMGSLAYQNYRITDSMFDATIEGGMLKVSRLAGKAWGGTVEATAFADARASRVALKAAATGINVNALLKNVANKDILEGTGRVTLNLETAGRSVNEMKARLQGAAALQLRDGAIKGINLAKSLRQAQAKLKGAKQDVAQQTSDIEKTDFSELSASFTVDEGVAHNSDLDCKSPFLRLTGAGSINVPQSRIDYTLRTTVTGTSKGQGGEDLAALKGLTIPVQLNGPLDAIDWTIQWSGLAASALKTEVVEKVQDKLKERLKERLNLPGASSAASAPSGAATPKDLLKERLKGLFH